MSAPTTTNAWARLQALQAKVRSAEQRVTELEEEQRHAKAEWERAKETRLAYLRAVEAGSRRPDDGEERRLAGELERAEGRLTMRPAMVGTMAVLEPVDEQVAARLDGARRALEDRRTELERFMRQQFEALAAELTVEARQTSEAVAEALPALLEAELAYRRVRARWRRLLKANGLPFDLPDNPLRGFADDVDPAGVPIPVPPALQEED